MSEAPHAQAHASVSPGPHHLPVPVPAPAPDKLSERLKHLPALIAAFTALFTAIAAFRKPPDTTASKAGYEELAKAIQEVSKANGKNHEDIVALHAYLKAYAEVLATMKQAGPRVAEATPRAAGERDADRPASGKGRRPAADAGKPAADAGKSAAGAGKPADAPAPVKPVAPEAAGPAQEKPALPPVAPEPRLVVPRSFKTVVDEAK